MMLFKALLTRLSGGTNASSSHSAEGHRRFAKTIYGKYHLLSDLVVRLLQESARPLDEISSPEHAARQIQMAFPAMEIVERIGVPTKDTGMIQELLSHQLENPVWNLREQAARTMSLFIDADTIIQDLGKLTESTSIPQNALHGRLLCLRYICEENNRIAKGCPHLIFSLSDYLHPTIEDLLSTIDSLLLIYNDLCCLKDHSPLNVAAYLQVLFALLSTVSELEGRL